VISDDVLGDLLQLAGNDVEVPADGADRVRAAMEPLRRESVAPTEGRWRGWVRPRGPRLAAIAAGIVVVALVGTAIGTSAGHHGGSSAASSAGVAASVAADAPQGLKAAAPPAQGSSTGNTSAASAGAAAGTAGAARALPTTTPRVVKTATIDLQVAVGAVGSTLDRLRALPAGSAGFVASSTSALAGDDPGGTVTLRVPVAAYATLRDALIAGTYGKPLTVQEAGQDVTAQYTDLAARLTTAEASRQTYLTLLSKANTIGDTLAVQQQIDALQQQIEQLQGQQKVLADESDLATITVTVSQKGASSVIPAAPRRGFDKAAHDAWTGFTGGLQDLVAASGVVVLVLIGLVIVGLASRIGIRIVRRRLI
jgi:hypothetical protein